MHPHVVYFRTSDLALFGGLLGDGGLPVIQEKYILDSSEWVF